MLSAKTIRKAQQTGSLFTGLAPITPGTAFKGGATALVVGVAGNVNVTMADGSSGILPLPAGVHKLAVTAVASASTTATGLFALY